MSERPEDIEEDILDDGGLDADESLFHTHNTEEPSASEEGAEEGEEDAPEGSEEDAATEEKLAGEDHLVELKVGDETRKVTVKELMGLYGKDAEVTAKSAELAEKVQRADQETQRSLGVLDKLLTSARAKAAEYAKVDFILAATKLDQSTYQQLRKDAQEAFDAVNFLQQEGNAVLQQAQANRAAQYQEAVKARDAALKADKDLRWTDSSMKELADFGVTMGWKPDHITNMIDPIAMKVIHAAMLYHRGKAAATKQVKAVATSNSKTTLRPGSAGAVKATADKAKEALDRLRRSGSMDDAEAAFMARFS